MDAFWFDERALSGNNASYRAISNRIAAEAEADPANGPIYALSGERSSLRVSAGILAGWLRDRRGGAVLRIVAHGTRGHIQLAEGLDMRNVELLRPLHSLVRKIEFHSCDVASAIPQRVRTVNRLNVGVQEPDWRQGAAALLSGVGRSDEDVVQELRSGEVTSATGRAIRDLPGVRFIIRLSAAVGCRVVAAMVLQTLSANNWNFEGSTLTAWGSGLTLNVPPNDRLLRGAPAGTYSIPQ